MAVIIATIQPSEQRPEVTEIQKALISLGAKIEGPELFTATTAGRLGPKTQAAITALLLRFGFSQGGQQAHFNVHVGRLLNIAVEAELGSSAALQKAVRESFTVSQGAGPSELAWLARYAVIARDFTKAREIIDLIPGNSPAAEEKKKIAAIVKSNTLQPPKPELVNPENYYTVLYDYVSRSEVEELFPGT